MPARDGLDVSPLWWRIKEGKPGLIVTGRTGNSGDTKVSGELRASSSVVTVTVTSEERVRSIGEEAEEAGCADHCRVCVNH
jgi:hypothetical protein